jgi:hypothetical protein
MLLKNADAAMSPAGRDKVYSLFQFYTGNGHSGAAAGMALETALRQALERQKFGVAGYQPQVDLKTGHITEWKP